jgi:hypothetical protein
MSEINVISKTQRIVVDPFSSSVSVINAGPQGPQGVVGPTGPPGPGAPNEYVRADGTVDMTGVLKMPGVYSNAITLNDDQACYIAFPGLSVQNCIWITGNSAGAGAGFVAFRCGDASAFASALAISGVITTGVGALTTGTTDGTDANLNIFAQNATAPRLYIKNRTGAARSYRYAIMSGLPGAAPVLV